MESFNLESYLRGGVERMVGNLVKISLKNPKAGLFMAQYAAQSRRALALRERSAKEGTHIPPFLIASITTQCNLHCKGCYARANHSCCDDAGTARLLTDKKWGDLFRQAAELGVGFVLLAGGEPFVRRDVLETAGREKRILFPIFTNGTMLDAPYLELLDRSRNLVPILSIEGTQETTDARRGPGVYEKLKQTMAQLHSRDILFGASVTVTRNNLLEVLSDCFVSELSAAGCRAIIYVEYVPIDRQTQALALDDSLRNALCEHMDERRTGHPEMLLLSFPGDEKSSGGCLAAGRGFFHINAYGGAEPCPFSPYSDTSLTNTPLLDALRSPLFRKLQSGGNLVQEHIGGCVLFEQEEQVREMLEAQGV